MCMFRIIAFIAFLITFSEGYHSMDRYRSSELWLDHDWKRSNFIGPAARYHEVDQDHFDGTNTNTWNQAYFVNDTFWKGDPKAPVFLCVGGEGPPLDGSVVVASPHCNIAVEWLEETGAIMFAVEHRYYGCHNMSACPVDSFDAGVSAFKFLSSRQALGDLARFHQYAVKTYNLQPTNKWVSFGGSYPGMLAGWFRLKFPHLVFASVSSSAPVLAQVDMTCYFDVAANAYTVDNNGIGGSQACHDAIADGHATIGKMFLTGEGRKQLVDVFNLSHSPEWLKDKENQLSFAGNGVAYFPSQGNDPVCSRDACNIKKICKIMTDESISDNIHRLARVRQVQVTEGILTPIQPKWTDYWGYQTCAEFGFYQTCEVGSKCFFTQGLLTLESEISFCESKFGVSTKKVYRNVEFTNDYYGGLNSGGSRILSPNGEVDPWHCLAILNSSDPQRLPTIWVEGASHHAWTHPSSPDDQLSVVQARKEIRAQVSQWLSE